MSIVDLAFSGGDLVVRNGDLVVVSDNEAILQALSLNLNLQTMFNQYHPDAGWDWMRWQGADVGTEEIDQILRQVKSCVESVESVRSASVTYLGFADDELQLDILVETDYGVDRIPYALGVANVSR